MVEIVLYGVWFVLYVIDTLKKRTSPVIRTTLGVVVLIENGTMNFGVCCSQVWNKVL